MMPEGYEVRSDCDLCGADLKGKHWVLLNRYAIGTGRNRCMVEPQSDGEYLWEVEDGDDFATGTLLCVEPCLLAWLEGKRVSVDFEVRQRHGRADGLG